MICYYCQSEIKTGFFWAPLPRVGAYAAICRECEKKIREEAKAKKAEAAA